MPIYEPIRKAAQYAASLKSDLYQGIQRISDIVREKARSVREDYGAQQRQFLAPAGLEFAVLSATYIPVKTRETVSLLMPDGCSNND